MSLADRLQVEMRETVARLMAEGHGQWEIARRSGIKWAKVGHLMREIREATPPPARFPSREERDRRVLDWPEIRLALRSRIA